MEGKMFSMLEKIYGELQGVRVEVKENSNRLTNLETKVDGVENGLIKLETKVDGVENGLIKLETKVDGVENKLRKLEIKVENNLERKIDILYDGYVHNTEALTRVEDKVDTLTEKVAEQDVEIRVIKGGR